MSRRPAALGPEVDRSGEHAAGAGAGRSAAGTDRSAAGAAVHLSEGSPRLVAIGQAAAQAGVSERTLRYYEELGLVRPAGHSPGGSRRYGSEQVERVLRIRELQELLGLNLEEIRALLAHDVRRSELRAAWEADDDPVHRRAILEEAIDSNAGLRAMLLAKRQRMDAMIADIDERLARLREMLAASTVAPAAGRPAGD